MREILFRGKLIIDDGWLYGLLMEHHQDSCSIMSAEDGEMGVHPHTVGQYTNVHDQGGGKIFQDDVVRGEMVMWGGKSIWLSDRVYWERGGWQLEANYLYGITKKKIIGNIHDNPELLKEQNENRS